jgi:hypothetical protein
MKNTDASPIFTVCTSGKDWGISEHYFQAWIKQRDLIPSQPHSFYTRYSVGCSPKRVLYAQRYKHSVYVIIFR